MSDFECDREDLASGIGEHLDRLESITEHVAAELRPRDEAAILVESTRNRIRMAMDAARDALDEAFAAGRASAAQAIEARSAETRSGSVEDESAVGEAEAPSSLLSRLSAAEAQIKPDKLPADIVAAIDALTREVAIWGRASRERAPAALGCVEARAALDATILARLTRAAEDDTEATCLTIRAEKAEAARDEACARAERVEKALREMVYETTHLSPCEDDGSHWCRISKAALAQSRAALAAEGKD